MLYFEQMNLQHEDVGYVHDDGSYGPNKRIMEMHRWDCVFENDEDVDFHADSYAGWWYCCIPVKKIDRSHLPVPLFIRGDDVEFSVAIFDLERYLHLAQGLCEQVQCQSGIVHGTPE